MQGQGVPAAVKRSGRGQRRGLDDGGELRLGGGFGAGDGGGGAGVAAAGGGGAAAIVAAGGAGACLVGSGWGRGMGALGGWGRAYIRMSMHKKRQRHEQNEDAHKHKNTVESAQGHE